MLTAPALIAVLPAVAMVFAADPEPPGCVVVDSIGRCVVEAYDPGRPGGPLDPDRDDESPPEPRPPRDEPADDTDAEQPSPRPRIEAMPLGDGWVQGEALDADAILNAAFVDGMQPLDPVVIGELLAQRAVEELALAPPVVRTSTADTGFVGVPMWLWIGDEGTGPVTATATAGSAQVTAVARLSGVEWSMGPTGATVRCTGTGTPWTGQDGPSPDCGYVYENSQELHQAGGETAGRLVSMSSEWLVSGRCHRPLDLPI